MNCKNCKHWDNKSMRHKGQIGMKSLGYCKEPKIVTHVAFGYGDDKPFHEDFGCIHFNAIVNDTEILLKEDRNE